MRNSWWMKGSVVGTMLLCVVVSILPAIGGTLVKMTIGENTLQRGIIYVDDDADPSWYDATHVKTFQEGIDNASVGDTVFVYNGTYTFEVIPMITKTIDVIGEEKNSTFLVHIYSGYALIISANNVTLEGFTIQGGVSVETGNNLITDNIITENIWISSNYNTVSRNTVHGLTIPNSAYNMILENIFTAPVVISGSSNNTITENILKRTTFNVYDEGLLISSSPHNIITGNRFESTGITIAGDKISHWNTHVIENNTANGRPIRYYKNDKNIMVPQDTAEVILANCENFTVQNLTLLDGSVGVQLGFSSYNWVGSNTITNMSYSNIQLESSDYNTISGNTVRNSYVVGILIFSSSNNNLTGNQFINNWFGLEIESSFNTRVFDNTFIDDGINLYGDSEEHYTTTSIENNTANGRPIYYYTNMQDITVPSDAAQVILYQCTNFTLHNLNLSNVDTGVQKYLSSQNVITNNTILNNNEGIICYLSNSNVIAGNTLTGKTSYKLDDQGISYLPGIELASSHDNTLFNNTIISYGLGIGVDVSDGNNIFGNNILNTMLTGIEIYSSSSTNIYQNKIVNYTYFGEIFGGEGIWIESSHAINISHNHIGDNTSYGYGISLLASRSNSIEGNQIEDNIVGIGLQLANNNNIETNTLFNNWYGVDCYQSRRNSFLYNTFTQNNAYGILFELAGGNKVFYNNFINNSGEDASFTLCHNHWKGNYWNEPRSLPKVISGKGVLFSWFNIDWRPTQEPNEQSIDQILPNEEQKIFLKSTPIKIQERLPLVQRATKHNDPELKTHSSVIGMPNQVFAKQFIINFYQ
jgi:parallel beta-helix repeat protein